MPGKMAWLKYSTVINLIRIHLRLTRVKVKTKMHSYLKCVMSNTFGTLVRLMVNFIEEGSCGWHLVEKIKNSMKSQKKKNSKYILVYSSQGSQEGTNTEMMQRGKKWMNEMKTVTSVWQHTWLQSVFRSRVQVKISRRRLLQLWFWFVCVICSVPTSVRTKKCAVIETISYDVLMSYFVVFIVPFTCFKTLSLHFLNNLSIKDQL